MTEIIKAAKAAYAHEFIMNTDGYDTELVPADMVYQRKAKSFSCEAIKNPRILILMRQRQQLIPRPKARFRKHLRSLPKEEQLST